MSDQVERFKSELSVLMTGQHSFLDANRAKRFLQDQIGFIGMSNDNMWINLVAVIMKEKKRKTWMKGYTILLTELLKMNVSPWHANPDLSKVAEHMFNIEGATKLYWDPIKVIFGTCEEHMSKTVHEQITKMNK